MSAQGQLPMYRTEMIENLISSLEFLKFLDIDDRICAINDIRAALHKYSPFKNEPVDCVLWVKADLVTANDYNPNAVAPPEMKLLAHSITADGYTQPIVSWTHDDIYEVVDGFHRHRVGKEHSDVRDRIFGYLPLVIINSDRQERGDRIAATIRHNRARGKHRVDAMSDIVIELKRRNWSDDRIARELGMDADEVLRLCQITGLAETFKNAEFSQAWEVDDPLLASESTMFSDVLPAFEPTDKGRLFHTWDKWECYRAGFYSERPPNGMTQDEGEIAYQSFLADLKVFESSLKIITETWVHSCEHYLTNDRMNRIAWLGQASVAHALGIPSMCRGGYNLLTTDQQRAADELALSYLNRWLTANGREAINMEAALGRTEVELY